VKLCYCHLDRGSAVWPEYASPTQPGREIPTNLAGVRIEPGANDDAFDIQITDNLFTNYTATTDVHYGCKGVLMFSTTERFCHDITFENNTFDNVNVAVYVKGSGPNRPVKGGLTFRRNRSRISPTGDSPDLFHYNLSDSTDTYGPNVFVQNLAYGGRSFVRAFRQGDGPILGLQVVNNTVVNLAYDSNEDGLLIDGGMANQNVATWRIHNNILHTGPKFYCFPYTGGDRSIQSRDTNTAYTLAVSYSDVGDASPTIGQETLTQLQTRTGRELSSAVRDPLLESTTWADPDFGKLQSISDELDSGVDVLDLLNDNVEASINRAHGRAHRRWNEPARADRREERWRGAHVRLVWLADANAAEERRLAASVQPVESKYRHADGHGRERDRPGQSGGAGGVSTWHQRCRHGCECQQQRADQYRRQRLVRHR
jgi:hypothetical protein